MTRQTNPIVTFVTFSSVSVGYFPSVIGLYKGQTLLVFMTWLRAFSSSLVSSHRALYSGALSHLFFDYLTLMCLLGSHMG